MTVTRGLTHGHGYGCAHGHLCYAPFRPFRAVSHPRHAPARRRSHDEHVQEQITRVLVERLIVHRPHPWGLLVTFIELIKNPRYNFWSKNFTRCAPEIERLFESVARSYMAPGSSSAAPPELSAAATAVASS